MSSIGRSALRLSLTGSFLHSLNGVDVSFAINGNVSKTLNNGTAANQINTWAKIVANAATGAGTTHNLNALAQAFGSVNFANVKCVLLINKSSVAAETITVGAAAATPFLGPLGGTTPTETVRAGMPLLWPNFEADGWTTSGANNLKIVAASGTPQYELYIGGEGTLT